MMNDIEIFSSELLDEKYYKTVHKSGLRIYVCPKDMSTTYGVLSINFGGNITEYEADGETVTIPQGCAHFLEHKLFDNPDGSNADDVFSSLGAYSNAYTSNTSTAYLFSTTDNVYQCLEHLVYFVTHPYFTDETVKKEIGIIAEEIRGCVDDPYDRCYVGAFDGMYFNNPVKNEICGSEESISEITPETLYRCCKDFYTPSNMILTVSGRVNMQDVLDSVDKALELSGTKCGKEICFTEPSHVKRAYTEKRMPIGKPLFSIGIKDVNIPTDPYERYKRSESVNILLHMLFSEAGDFYLEMLESGLLSPGFDFGYSANATTAYVMLSGESDDPVKLLDKIKGRIRECRASGISRRDFEREKKCMYAAYIADFDMTEDIAFSMNSYASEGMDLFVYPDMINSISFEDTEKMIGEIFKEEYFTLSVVYPNETEKENQDVN